MAPATDLAPAMAADRLSALPDRVLHRVLSYLDVKEAPLTSLLSRRWRTLWRQSDAVSLDTRSYWGVGYDGGEAGRLLFRDALAVVRTGGRCPVRKLSVLIDSYFQSDYLEDAMRASPGMDALLAAPAVQGVEEVSVVLRAEFGGSGGDYVLPASLLPWRSLRVLELQGCTLGPPGTAVLGHLETLRMVLCISSSENLQGLLDAAPNLARLWLRRVSFRAGVLLRCPKAMVAVALIHCHRRDTDGIYLDAPNARFLRYKGFLEHFPFSSTLPSGRPTHLQHLELSFCTSRCGWDRPSSEILPHASFWESIGSFSRLRFLKLKLLDINVIAVHPEQEDRLLKVFPDLKFLQIKGSYEVDTHSTSVAIANLLYCCPAMQEFRLKFKVHGDLYNPSYPKIIWPEERRAQLDLEKSMESLKRLKSKITTSPGYSVDDDRFDEMDLSALRARSFSCLDSHLRKIRLEFELECFDCFEVKIAKFLVENAAVLDEMEVGDGDQRVYDHIHHKLAIWRANSFKRRINIVGSTKKVPADVLL